MSQNGTAPTSQPDAADPSLRWIDIHLHLNMLKTDAEAALASAAAQGVTRVITIGTEPKDHPLVLDWAARRFPQVACTLGVHPHEATLWSKEVRQFIFDNRQAKGLVAVGEIGLDYYYNNSPQDVQIAAFREQMQLAEELDLPVQIHTRDADADTAKILREFSGRVRGLLHCFTSSAELAREALDCGFDLSFSGVVTFKNAQALRDVVREVPLDRLHVETDAPFLAPVPKRGQSNVPEFVLHTAQAVAELKSVTLAELSRQTLANASRLFNRLGS